MAATTVTATTTTTTTTTSTVPKMPPNGGELYARAFWDPTPTTSSILKQRQLAYALGYPIDWRVERQIEKIPTTKTDDKKKICIIDKIHAIGKQGTKYTWFHHDDALKALSHLEETGSLLPDQSHLLPPKPLYNKGDEIQVFLDNTLYPATIVKRKRVADDFFYTVHYTDDDEVQNNIAQEDIRPGQDPHKLAQSMGFTMEWSAIRKGSRYTITAPNGTVFTTRKAAMQHYKQLKQKEREREQQKKKKSKKQPPKQIVKNDVDMDEGDPPFRLQGHEWIGRRIQWTTSHKVSGTRTIKITQMGTVIGFIADTDLDSQGNPGFVSDVTGKPAHLFHVIFDDVTIHPYPQYLLHLQDLEEHEIEGALVPKEEVDDDEIEKEAKQSQQETLNNNNENPSNKEEEEKEESSTPKKRKVTEDNNNNDNDNTEITSTPEATTTTTTTDSSTNSNQKKTPKSGKRRRKRY